MAEKRGRETLYTIGELKKAVAEAGSISGYLPLTDFKGLYFNDINKQMVMDVFRQVEDEEELVDDIVMDYDQNVLFLGNDE